ncbi:MAG TPA: PASTA domain-containing protein [Prolixibacteraceae bacterium]|nr:PASTA domain-containing protein [Prolixibacteraceae bacterium]
MPLKEFLKSKSFLKHLVLIILLFVVLTWAVLHLLRYYTHHGQEIAIPNLKGLTLEEVEIEIHGNKLRYKVNDSVYVRDAVPGTVLEQYPEAGFPVKQKRIVYLTLSTYTPEKVHVPKVVDISLREAKSRLEGSGLQAGKIIYRPSEFLNLVLEQHYEGRVIAPDTLLPKGSAVDLIVGKGLSNEQTSVPDLTLMTLEEARSLLYESSLNTGALVYDESVLSATDSLYARIWKQQPGPDSINRIELGTSIDLWLSIDDEKLFELTDDFDE